MGWSLGERYDDFGGKGLIDLGADIANLKPSACTQTSPSVVAGGVVIVAARGHGSFGTTLGDSLVA